MPSLFRPFFTYNAASVVVEDTPRIIGVDIKNGIGLVNPTGVDPGTPSVTLSNFTPGTILSWTPASTGPSNRIITSASENVIFTTYAELETLSLQAPPQSDTDMTMQVTLTTPGTYTNSVSTFSHPIKVLAVADKPQVVATTPLAVLETGKVPLNVSLTRSADTDGSESLVVRFTVNPSQGILQGVSNEAVTFTANTATGEYTLTTTKSGDPALQQAILNSHFSNKFVEFVPTYGFGGQANVTVEVMSVENAAGTDLAPSTPTDPDTKVESVFTL